MSLYSKVRIELYTLEQQSKWLRLLLLLNKGKEKLKDVSGFKKYSRKEQNLKVFTLFSKN